jgi:hypothetical protein
LLPDTSNPNNFFTFKFSPTKATSLEKYNPESAISPSSDPSHHILLDMQTYDHTYDISAYYQLEKNLGSISSPENPMNAHPNSHTIPSTYTWEAMHQQLGSTGDVTSPKEEPLDNPAILGGFITN